MRSLCFTLIFLVIFVSLSNAIIIEKIVAVVNGEPITLTELQERAIFIRGATGKDIPLKEVLRQVILEELQLQRAKKLGIDVSPEIIDSYIESFKKENHMSDEEFRNFLKERGITEKAYREEIRRRIIINKLRNYEIRLKVAVPDEEVKQYYEKHKEQFKTSPTADVWLIFIPEAKEDLAKEVYAKVIAGEDFATLAKMYSQGPRADEGGHIGIVKKGELIKELDDFIFNTKEKVGFIKRKEGFYIVKVEKRNLSNYIPFEQVKDKIKRKLMREKFEARYQHWLQELLDKAYIKIMM